MSSLIPKWMAKILGSLLIIFIVFLILNQINALQGPPHTMTISADGKATAIPDLATVTLGVVSTGQNPIDIKNTNNTKINQIISFIKQQGIPDKDIQTSTFYASPTYNYSNNQQHLNGYQATQTITVIVRNINQSQAQLEKIIDGAVNNGANQIQGINFSFDDMDKLNKIARKQAVEKAEEKAKELTSYADLKLGKIINVSESANNVYSYNRATPTVSFAAQAHSVAPNIQPGTQDVAATMTVVFEVY